MVMATAPRPTVTLTQICSPGRTASRKSSRASPAIAVTTVSVAAIELPERLVLLRIVVTLARRRLGSAGTAACVR